MRTAVFDYDLPADAVAQTPATPRDSARLLVDRGDGSAVEHRRIADLPAVLKPGDVLVVNDTRVMAARLHLRKPTGGGVEVLVLEPAGSGSREWEALVRPSRRVPSGTELVDDEGLAVLRVGDTVGDGRRLVTALGQSMDDLTAAVGVVPLPPYIHEPLADPERYQTVFADRATSVAAPTAGLHLTPALLGAIADRGVAVARLELSVGLATFRPIATDEVEAHVMHTERFRVPPETLDACEQATRVVAVGTTVVRALEAAAATGCREGRTDLFIRPGHRFRMVDALLTNFHLPRSSLLVLLAAFMGDRWRDLYATALDEGYRFLSFGDAMLVERRAA